ncbi:hypothetical protein SF293071_2370 [Shigella flexneri 2930-71]|nr:hypothetical protein SF293071_2370 [Shigella flexneri 2930-71]
MLSGIAVDPVLIKPEYSYNMIISFWKIWYYFQSISGCIK